MAITIVHSGITLATVSHKQVHLKFKTSIHNWQTKLYCVYILPEMLCGKEIPKIGITSYVRLSITVYSSNYFNIPHPVSIF